MENKKRITVFTPTYNRAYIITQLFDSLKNQTFSDFEWLVIDDGSSDNTEVLFEQFCKMDTCFSVRYYKQENGGKHRAVNKGLALANGEIFFVVDSDDYLVPDALQKLDHWFSEIGDKHQLAGVVANRGFSTEKTPNFYFHGEHLDMSFLEAQSYQEDGKFVLRGERAIAFYTNIHRNYLYPEFERENFVTEAVVYNRMAHDGYKMRFFNDIIWIYEYRDDGLSNKGTELYLNNPRGYGLWFRERAAFSKYSRIEKAKMYYSFYCDLVGRCTLEEIAEYIGMSMFAARVISVIYWIKRHI